MHPIEETRGIRRMDRKNIFNEKGEGGGGGKGKGERKGEGERERERNRAVEITAAEMERELNFVRRIKIFSRDDNWGIKDFHRTRINQALRRGARGPGFLSPVSYRIEMPRRYMCDPQMERESTPYRRIHKIKGTDKKRADASPTRLVQDVWIYRARSIAVDTSSFYFTMCRRRLKSSAREKARGRRGRRSTRQK